MIRVYDHGSTYGISIGQPEIQGFHLGRPACGLQGLRGLRLAFDRQNGNLIGLQVKGKMDHAQLDDSTLMALVDGMRRHAAAMLGIDHGPDHHWRVDWQQYRARKQALSPERVLSPPKTGVAGYGITKGLTMANVPIEAAAMDGYIERIGAGLCFECGKPYGVAPQERHLLPRVEREDRWEFVAPCGHAVLGIKKGSQLAKTYRLTKGGPTIG